jgi:hypothetical protein
LEDNKKKERISTIRVSDDTYDYLKDNNISPSKLFNNAFEEVSHIKKIIKLWEVTKHEKSTNKEAYIRE